MTQINYVTGDATRPRGGEDGRPRIIVHVVNDKPAWGAGFVVALSARWRAPESSYRAWARSREQAELDPSAERRGAQYPPFELGQILIVQVEQNLYVANVLAQHGIRWEGDVPPIRYEALEQGLGRVAEWAAARGASVHGPRLGAGLAGGQWGLVERMLTEAFCARDIPVTIYDLPQDGQRRGQGARRRQEPRLRDPRRR